MVEVLLAELLIYSSRNSLSRTSSSQLCAYNVYPILFEACYDPLLEVMQHFQCPVEERRRLSVCVRSERPSL